MGTGINVSGMKVAVSQLHSHFNNIISNSQSLWM